MSQEAHNDFPKFKALFPDITTPLFASNEEGQPTSSRRLSPRLNDIMTSLHATVVSWAMSYYFTDSAPIDCPTTLWSLRRAGIAQLPPPRRPYPLYKPYYSPNLHILKMVTEQQVAAARAAASAFDANGNRVCPLPLSHIASVARKTTPCVWFGRDGTPPHILTAKYNFCHPKWRPSSGLPSGLATADKTNLGIHSPLSLGSTQTK